MRTQKDTNKQHQHRDERGNGAEIRNRVFRKLDRFFSQNRLPHVIKSGSICEISICGAIVNDKHVMQLILLSCGAGNTCFNTHRELPCQSEIIVNLSIEDSPVDVLEQRRGPRLDVEALHKNPSLAACASLWTLPVLRRSHTCWSRHQGHWTTRRLVWSNVSGGCASGPSMRARNMDAGRCERKAPTLREPTAGYGRHRHQEFGNGCTKSFRARVSSAVFRRSRCTGVPRSSGSR